MGQTEPEKKEKLILSRNNLLVLSVLLVFLLAFALLFFTSDINRLNLKIEEQGSRIAVLAGSLEKISGNISELESDKNALEAEKTRLQNANESLGTSLEALKRDSNSTISEIREYEKKINDSMDWFRENSELPEPWPIKEALNNFCIGSASEGQPVLFKTRCFSFFNGTMYRLEYKRDIATSGKEDKLLSIQQFIDNKGGDCEDYSLFYKAEYNYFLEKHPDYASRGISLEAVCQGDCGVASTHYDKYFSTFENQWFLQDVNVVLIKGFNYAVVVCGNLLDTQTNAVTGHCAIAFTKNRISDESQIDAELDGAPLIEPQNGYFLGYINNAYSGIYLQSNPNSADDGLVIYSLITDEDYYVFDNEKEFKWLGYSYFLQRLSENKKALSEALAAVK